MGINSFSEQISKRRLDRKMGYIKFPEKYFRNVVYTDVTIRLEPCYASVDEFRNIGIWLVRVITPDCELPGGISGHHAEPEVIKEKFGIEFPDIQEKNFCSVEGCINYSMQVLGSDKCPDHLDRGDIE